MACWETPFNKKLYLIETSQLICNVNEFLHINKHEVYLIENQIQRGKNIKIIKICIQSTQLNIVKTGSEQIEQMSFSFFSFFLFNV